MIRLVGAELTRLRWRRAVMVLVAAAVVIPVLVGLATAWNTRPYSDSEVREARAQAQSEPGFTDEVRMCERRPGRFGVESAEACEEQVVGWRTNLYREELDLRHELRNSGPGVAVVLGVLLLLVGTTFAGADWASGSMSNQLLFEPRRLRVWWAKAVAVGAVAGVVAVVVQSLFWLGLGLVAASRGIEVPGSVIGEIAWMIARSTGVVGLAALTGYALTMLVRSTVFTLGVTFAISAGGSVLVAALPLGPGKERWMPPINLLAVIQGRAGYWVEPPAECFTRGADPSTYDAAMRQLCNGQATLTVWDGLVFLLVPALLVVVVSLWSFRRRDVP